MLDSIKNLYNAENLPGEILLTPLKKYNAFFAKEGTNWQKVAYKIAQIALGILAYPLLGSLAVLGMLVKLTSVPGLYKHNKGQKAHLDTIAAGVRFAETYATESSVSINKQGYHLKTVREFHVTKQNIATMHGEMKQAIDKLSRQFERGYFKSEGIIIDGQGEILVQLRIFKKN